MSTLQDATKEMTQPMTARVNRTTFWIALIASLAIVALTGARADNARAEFGIVNFDGSVLDAQGDAFTQAGGHPASASTIIEFSSFVDNRGQIAPEGRGVKDIRVDLPVGFVGDPTATPKCAPAQLAQDLLNAKCPQNSQVGVATLALDIGAPFPLPLGPLPLFNMEPPPGSVAAFATRIFQQVIQLVARVRPDDHGVTVEVRNASQAARLIGSTVTLWGVPADPAHDAERTCPGNETVGCPTDAPPRMFLTNPTACTPPGVGLVTTIRANSWDDQANFAEASFESHLPPGFTDFMAPLPRDQWGPPQGPTGCADVPFDPAIDVRPTSLEVDSPTGLEVELTIPSEGLENPTGIAQANLKRAVVTLPEGMTVNPGSADGLGSCAQSQIGLGTSSEPACPGSSRIGSVEIDTPLLEQPLRGAVYLAEPRANPFGSLLALYITAIDRERGIFVKLAGHVEADPVTGRLRTTFDDNPQLPFSNLRLSLKDGPRAPLVTPATCGVHTVEGSFSPWSAADPQAPTAAEVVSVTDSFSLRCPGGGGFSPSLLAGTALPVAGAFSPLSMQLSRPDGSQALRSVDVTLPEGLLGMVGSVPLCAEAAAAAGTCAQASRVGDVLVAAGAGASPLWVPQAGRAPTAVYLAGPYKGAPYSLSIVVPAQAGPFDLGTVVVRAALFVDPVDAHVTVKSDPLPTILEGIPLRVREVRVRVDRERFTFNPTSCAPKQIAATIGSAQGASAQRNSPFAVGDCAELALRPRLRLRLTGRRQTRDGDHPGLRATLRQPEGQSNLKRVAVRLPLSLALDPENAQSDRLCEFEAGQRVDCPASSIIGRARAVSPALAEPLTGPVYFVKNVRTDRRTGRQIRTLPTLLIPLRGEVAIDLRATSSVRRGRLVTTFATVPDAPVSRFELRLRGGRRGILVVTNDRDLCEGRHVARAGFRGHSGRRYARKVRFRTPCSPRRRTG